MTIFHDLLQPIDNITAGIGGAVSGIGHGVGSGIKSIGGGVGNIYSGFGKMMGSPLTLIFLVIGGVVVLSVLR